MSRTDIHIIEGVVEITKHRDRELIGASLVRTIADQIRYQSIALYYLHKKDDPVVLSMGACVDSSSHPGIPAQETSCLPHELSACILECLGTGEMVETRTGSHGLFQAVFPVCHDHFDLTAFLVILHDGSSPELQRLVSGFLKIYRNFMLLLDASQRDPLTGLLNRQTFDDQIAQIITNPISRSLYIHLYANTGRRIPDETFAYWMAILDIDNFKRVNDTFGHVYGDEVLLLLAQLMKSAFRKDDLLFRYGGEEFIVVLKAPARREAEIALEGFRKTVENHISPQVGQITISMGYIQIMKGDVPVIVFWHADQALFYAKNHGKNRVCCYEELIARGELQDMPIQTGAIELFRNTFPKQSA